MLPEVLLAHAAEALVRFTLRNQDEAKTGDISANIESGSISVAVFRTPTPSAVVVASP